MYWRALNKERNKKTLKFLPSSAFALQLLDEPSSSSSLGAELLECDGKLMCELTLPAYTKTRVILVIPLISFLRVNCVTEEPKISVAHKPTMGFGVTKVGRVGEFLALQQHF